MRFLLFGIHRMGSIVLQRLLEEDLRPLALVTKNDSGPETIELLELARRNHLEVWSPDNPNAEEWTQRIRSLQADITVVAGYHRKLSSSTLGLARLGTINVHGSLLPKYRGPSTWKQAILNGEPSTGVSIHVMTPELDRGDILSQESISIDEYDTGETLFLKICRAGAKLLPTTLKEIEKHGIIARPQDETQATYYSYLNEADTRVDWARHAEAIRNQVRGLYPRPGAWAEFHGERYQVSELKQCHEQSTKPAGSLLAVQGRMLRLATLSTDVWIRLDRELPPGIGFGKQDGNL